MDVRKQRDWINRIINFQEDSKRLVSSKNSGQKENPIQSIGIKFILIHNVLYILIAFSL